IGYLSELQPEMFCEVSPRLAAERGLSHRGWATIVTARTAIEARVMVTERMPTLRVHDRLVETVGLPYHWGWRGMSVGDSANHVPDDGLNWLGNSYDNTGALGCNSWRHVAFVEQRKQVPIGDPHAAGGLRWLMASDVCKHCAHAACVDVCPTGALTRTEFDTV